jgi:hypothetical protein
VGGLQLLPCSLCRDLGGLRLLKGRGQPRGISRPRHAGQRLSALAFSSHQCQLFLQIEDLTCKRDPTRFLGFEANQSKVKENESKIK